LGRCTCCRSIARFGRSGSCKLGALPQSHELASCVISRLLLLRAMEHLLLNTRDLRDNQGHDWEDLLAVFGHCATDGDGWAAPSESRGFRLMSMSSTEKPLSRLDTTAAVCIQAATRGWLARRRVVLCPICYELGRNPTSVAGCGHLLCGPCAARCTLYSSRCPVCRQSKCTGEPTSFKLRRARAQTALFGADEISWHSRPPDEDLQWHRYWHPAVNEHTSSRRAVAAQRRADERPASHRSSSGFNAYTLVAELRARALRVGASHGHDQQYHRRRTAQPRWDNM
jgi:hypothetical protein